ncbi:TetR/AcrR family transcriptional regulator [Mycolicibacterium sp.]|uniref:TetR/AcrR family transcriptional regulator n=1 Tax=Mycolicibacterium sp. TaxID=2320850 RepID=UPI003D097584
MARSRATDNAALLKAAAEVFESKGYRNATIDDIAASAGISRPTVYKYTSNKRSLLDALVDQVADDLNARLGTVEHSDAPPAERLRQIVTLHVENAVAMRNFYAIVFSEQTELSERGRRRFKKFSHDVAANFQALLSECMAERGSDPHDLDIHILTNLILSMLTTLYRWYDPKGSVTPSELVDHILILLAGIVAAPASTG